MKGPAIPGFPRDFWQRTSVQAIDPLVCYVGPLPQDDRATLAIQAELSDSKTAFVYVIADLLDTLYVGKTVNPVGRFSSHRSRKSWWPSSGYLVLLLVDGVDRRDAETAALYLEGLCIAHLKPLYNIAGVRV